MLRSHFTESLTEKYYAAKSTVAADFIFTTPAVIVQPLTGAWLVYHSGYRWDDQWLIITYLLYALAGICWLPVVFIQLRLRTILRDCIEQEESLPDQYHRLFTLWMLLGVPAFFSLVLVFWLMVVKSV